MATQLISLRTDRTLVQFASVLLGILALVYANSLLASDPWRPNDPNAVILNLPASFQNPPANIQKHADVTASVTNDPVIEMSVEEALSLLSQATLVDQAELARYAGEAIESAISSSTTSNKSQWIYARARWRQFSHQFTASLDDLNIVLKQNPQHLSARLLRADLLRTAGEYDKARADCLILLRQRATLASILCGTANDLMTGKLSAALQRLSGIIEQELLDPNLRNWALQLQAQGLQQSGELASAVNIFTDLTNGNVKIRHDLLQLADLLLERNANKQVLNLLPEAPADEDLRLRRLIALSRSGDDVATTKLKSMSTEASQENSVVHLRDRVMLLIELGSPNALSVALLNWQGLKEPADLRYLAQAAQIHPNHLKRDQALTNVQAWVSSTGLEDFAVNQILNAWNEQK